MRVTITFVLFVFATAIAVATSWTSCKGADPLFCNSNEDCAGTGFAFCNTGQAINEAMNTCVNIDPDGGPGAACTGPTQCRPTNEVCDTEAGRCVACLEPTDCVTNGQNGQVCFPEADTEPVCGCTDHDECSVTKVCDIDTRRCLGEDQVIYVDNDSAAPAATCGALDAQCPTVQDGIDRAKEEGRVFVYVAAGTYDQNTTIELINATDQLSLIGEGKGVAIMQSLTSGVPVLTVKGQGAVVVDGVKLSRGGSNGGHGIQCDGGSLEVLRSHITDNQGIGIQARMGCKLTVRQTEFGNDPVGNDRGAIEITDGEFYLVNNIIAGNGTDASSEIGGIRFGGDATGTLEFNTIVNNAKANNTEPAGVRCDQNNPPGTVTARNNLVQDNMPGQVDINECVWTHSAVDMAAAMEVPANNNVGDPCARNADNSGRLDDTDTACFDKGTTPDPAVTTDFFGGVRPQGAQPDIGAHELK